VTAAELVHDLQVRGVLLVADGGILRCRPTSALSQSDLAALKSMKAEVLATLAPVRQARRLICHCCRGHRFWISVHGATVCATCHPPATGVLVASRSETE
jgi:hypothetical protein